MSTSLLGIITGSNSFSVAIRKLFDILLPSFSLRLEKTNLGVPETSCKVAVTASEGTKVYVVPSNDAVKTVSLGKVYVLLVYVFEGVIVKFTVATAHLLERGVYPKVLAKDTTDVLFIAESKNDSFANKCARTAL